MFNKNNIFIIIILLSISTTGCGIFHPTIKDEYRETTRVDTVLVPVVRPEITATRDVVLKERIIIDTLGISLDIERLQTPIDTTTANINTGPAGSDSLNTMQFLDSLRINITRKPDTTNVAVEEKVVTKERTKTKIDYRTPWWNWVGYGILIAVIGLLVIKMIIVPRFL